jgi:hypothetical protein
MHAMPSAAALLASSSSSSSSSRFAPDDPSAGTPRNHDKNE